MPSKIIPYQLAILHHESNSFELGNVGDRISGNGNEISKFPGLRRAHAILPAPDLLRGACREGKRCGGRSSGSVQLERFKEECREASTSSKLCFATSAWPCAGCANPLASPPSPRHGRCIGGRRFLAASQGLQISGVALGGSVKADLAAHGFDELRGVVADAVLEDHLNLFDVFDIGRGVSLQHHDVGCFAGSQRADFVELAEEFGRRSKWRCEWPRAA